MKLPHDLKSKMISLLEARKKGDLTQEQATDLSRAVVDEVGTQILELLNNADIPRVGLTGLALISIGLDVCAETKVNREMVEMLTELYYSAETKRAN